MKKIPAAVSVVILAMTNLHTSADAFSPSTISAGVTSSSRGGSVRHRSAPTELSSSPSPPPSSTPHEQGETIVIGGGRIGSLISSGAKVLGRADPLSTSINPDGSGPIFVATRNDVLPSIVDGCPASRRKDLVFLQNGYLDDFLRERGLSDNTQALLYLSVTARGGDPVDGVTPVDPGGLTAATGAHARAFADRLASLGLKCKVVSAEEYRPAMFEKLIWIATYMLVGTARDCESVGQAGTEHRRLVRDVISELTSAVSAREGIAFAPGTIERLEAYTDVVSGFPCGVKEFGWRNRYFYDLGDDACPIHNGLLRECAEAGKLGFELPAVQDAQIRK